MFPTVAEHFEVGAAKSWNTDPFAMGGASYFRRGDVATLFPHIARPEGRLHFAGEHTASLPYIGYMQGAIESGQRAAAEIETSPA